MGNVNIAGPNEAVVISGGCCGKGSKKIIGQWGWSWMFLSDVQRLSLGIMTLKPKSEDVETAQGVPLTVTGVAQVRVMTDFGLLDIACEQFLGKPVAHIENVLLQTLEGHLRAILGSGTMTVEAVFQDRDRFAQLVREVAAPDLGRMGMEILSFTIKDVVDSVDYLESLGKSQTAIVKKNAEIGVAEADRDAGIFEAECEKAAADATFSATANIANAKRELDMKQAEFDTDVSAKRAEAELAYDLQKAREMQVIRDEEIKIEVIEKRKNILIEEKETERKQQELNADVRLVAEAEAFRVETIASGQRARVIEIAEANAVATKKIGESSAAVIEMVGKAEGERLSKRAEAFKLFGDAAQVALVVDKVPEIAESITKPLKKTTEVLIVGSSDNIEGTITNLTATLPASFKTITGNDLCRTVRNVLGSNTSVA